MQVWPVLSVYLFIVSEFNLHFDITILFVLEGVKLWTIATTNLDHVSHFFNVIKSWWWELPKAPSIMNWLCHQILWKPYQKVYSWCSFSLSIDWLCQLLDIGNVVTTIGSQTNLHFPSYHSNYPEATIPSTSYLRFC